MISPRKRWSASNPQGDGRTVLKGSDSKKLFAPDLRGIERGRQSPFSLGWQPFLEREKKGPGCFGVAQAFWEAYISLYSCTGLHRLTFSGASEAFDRLPGGGAKVGLEILASGKL